MRKGRRKKAEELPHVNINEQIRSDELRVVADDGENYGVISFEEALKQARAKDLDLIEISPNAKPPVAKIMDYGKFQYDQKKKIKAQKAKAKKVEVKSVQIKVGTDENDLNIKAKRVSEWLEEGHRIKLELFLPGRLKYLEKNFLVERLNRVRKLITVEHNVAEEAKKVPKGLAMIIEKTK